LSVPGFRVSANERTRASLTVCTRARRRRAQRGHAAAAA
jgi:hypothetical protein